MAEAKLRRSQELAEICRHHHAALVRFLAVRTGSTEDAKEVLQEAYAKLLALESTGTIKLLAGYLWRTAVNLAMDRRREQAVHKRYSRSAALLADRTDFSADAVIESRERLEIVGKAIAGLPPRCLQAFVLQVIKGLTFEEIGREMGISTRMAQKHVARAMEYLQSCLDHAGQRPR